MCAEKIVRIPYGNETLIIHGDGRFPIFLAHVTAKEIEDKSEKKQLEDVPIVRDFPEVFLEDLPGLPPTRQNLVLSDYDCDIRYHPGKANVVADALSRKERESPLRVSSQTDLECSG
ncbi:hypothetical protein Tco_0102286 [Tanacetum coccineum]